MKPTLNLNLMDDNLNDFELLQQVSTKILHKKNIQTYAHKKHIKNMTNTSKQVEPEFDFIKFNINKSNSDSTITFDNKNISDYEFMDDMLSVVSSKHTGDEYSPQHDLQSAIESRLQEKSNRRHKAQQITVTSSPEVLQ